uniref:Lamin-L(III)-like n=1 Tax=Astyanax mexicanus TaxID=7994 RepID=A0A8B9K1V8_ASTMX
MITSTPAPAAARGSRAAGATPSSVSPTRLSRLQEKEDLRQLNDRLANYIERVRQLESDKSSMQLLLEEKEETTTRELRSVRLLYENELADARKTLDTTANERARLQIEYSQLCEDHRRLLESALQNAKTQINSETLRRVDVENQIQTLQEQMDFQKHVTEQEVREMRSRHETRLVEVDSGRQKEFESKLAEAMQQLRQEHEAQIQQYKDDLERTFSAKLENAKQVAVKNSDFATSTKEELAGTKLRLESQSLQISNLQTQNSTLEARVQELERMLDRERQVSHQRLSQKDQEMADMRQQMQTQLEEYQSLLDLKLMLDMEINAYRKMLEGEEKRLNLSPSPSQHSSIARTHAQGTRKAGSKKRKHEGASGLSPSYKVSQHSSSRGVVSIDEIDLMGNFIKLRNNSDTDQSLGGWVVRKRQSGTPDVVFKIPKSCILRAEDTVTIWSAGAGVEPNPPTDLVLSGLKTWGAVSDVLVSLFNTHNEEAAERSVVCVQSRAEGNSDVEVDEESGVGSEIHLRRQVLYVSVHSRLARFNISLWTPQHLLKLLNQS